MSPFELQSLATGADAGECPARRPLTPKMLAERWRYSAAHIRALCKREDLPHFRLGDEYRIPVRVVEAIESCSRKTFGSGSTEALGPPPSGESVKRPPLVVAVPRER